MTAKENNMPPDPSELIAQIDLTTPLVGFYDSPETQGYDPLVRPEPGKHMCIFCFYEDWLKGSSLVITKDNFGCGGAGNCLCNVQTMTREDHVRFLVDGEGLKASPEIMHQWLDSRRSYESEHPYLIIGPFRPEMYEYLKSVTFFVNPDQLSALIIGANYQSAPDG